LTKDVALVYADRVDRASAILGSPTTTITTIILLLTLRSVSPNHATHIPSREPLVRSDEADER
jgi:hypothetical protein